MSRDRQRPKALRGLPDEQLRQWEDPDTQDSLVSRLLWIFGGSDD